MSHSLCLMYNDIFRHVTLTNHKKSVRALTLHPTQYTFASAAPDNIKQWKFPDGKRL